MLNYVTGAILFIAKKSSMVTIVNVVDAIIVLGITLVWATNVTDVAIAWMIGDVGTPWTVEDLHATGRLYRIPAAG